MTKLIFFVWLFTILFLGRQMIHADVAAAATQPSVCYAQEKECLDKNKESPNDIDRELCVQAREECLASYAEENRVQEEQKRKEQDLKEQEEKAQWDSQGLSPEEQQQIKLKRQQEESERIDKEADERAEREDRERAQKADEMRELGKEKGNQ